MKQKDPHNIIMYTKSFFFPTIPGPLYIYLICPFLPFSIHLIMKKEREMGRKEGNNIERKERIKEGKKGETTRLRHHYDERVCAGKMAEKEKWRGLCTVERDGAGEAKVMRNRP